MKRVLAVAALTSLLASACGSTVQLRSTSTAGDGLASPGQQQAGGLGGTTGLGTSGTGASGTAPGGLGPAGSSGTNGTTGGGTGGPTGGSTGVGPGSTTGAVTSGQTTGGVANHDPIQIGFVTTSVGNASQFGFSTGQSYTDESMFQALVSAYNKQGGLAGHKIVPVYGATDTASSNWSQQFAAVCAKFTQDNKVKVVIGYIFVFLQSFESCLAQAHVPHLYGGYQPGDVGYQKQIPTLVGTGHPTVDAAQLTPLAGALRSGLLTTKTKLGLLLDTCANGDRAYARTTEPWLKAHKINYQTVIGSCAQGATDVSGGAAAVNNAELKFASSGVNLVFGTGIPLLLFMEDAQSQGYQPEYLTSVGGAPLEANAPASQMKHLRGFGWMPSVDVNLAHQPYPLTSAQKACIAKLTAAGLRPSQYNDFMAAYQACDGLELYARALAAGAVTDTQVAAAVQRAMSGFPGTGTYGGALTASPAQHGGPSRAREYGWTDSCSCLTYRGPLIPIATS